MTSRGRKTPSKLGKAVTSNMVPTKDQLGDTRECEYMKSYIALAVAMIAWLLVICGNWGKISDSIGIVLIFIVIAFCVLCIISIGVHKKCRKRWIERLSVSAMKTEFGDISLLIGLSSLGISLLNYQQPLWGLLFMVIGLYVWGFHMGKQIGRGVSWLVHRKARR